MKKMFLTLIALVIAFAAYAAPTTSQSPAGEIFKTKYYAYYEVADFDTILGSTADTTKAFDMYLFGKNQPFPDAITFIFRVSSVKAGNAALTKMDTLIYEFDVCAGWDEDNIAERSLSWVPIWDNGNPDTVALGPDGTNLATGDYYAEGHVTLSASELAKAVLPWGRFVLTKTGDGTATDSAHIEIRMIQTYTGWKDD